MLHMYIIVIFYKCPNPPLSAKLVLLYISFILHKEYPHDSNLPFLLLFNHFIYSFIINGNPSGTSSSVIDLVNCPPETAGLYIFFNHRQWVPKCVGREPPAEAGRFPGLVILGNREQQESRWLLLSPGREMYASSSIQVCKTAGTDRKPGLLLSHIFALQQVLFQFQLDLHFRGLKFPYVSQFYSSISNIILQHNHP